jgi:DNA-binding transcriptional LysR family regulator
MHDRSVSADPRAGQPGVSETPRHAHKPAQLAQACAAGLHPARITERLAAQDAGGVVHIKPTIASSSGETLRSLALAGQGIVCLSDFMTLDDRQRGRLVQLFAKQTLDARQPINAVYYRNTALASDHLLSRPRGQNTGQASVRTVGESVPCGHPHT